MEYTQEVLDRASGELTTVSLGDWITITELGQRYGFGKKEVRAVLTKMGLLQIEGAANHTRYRLAPWAVEQGLGKRHERKGKIPFDVLSPKGQAWVDARWTDTVEELEQGKDLPVKRVQAALRAFQENRNAYRELIGGDPMTTKELVYWVVDHFPELTQVQISQVVDVSQPLVHRLLSDRSRQRAELLKLRSSVPPVMPRSCGYVDPSERPAVEL